MVAEQKDMKIPTDLIPKCPICGSPVTVNLRCDNTFVEDKGWISACDRYENFLRENHGKKILFLELGVGMNTPGIIKYPFQKMSAGNKNAVYACINTDEYPVSEKIKNSVCIVNDIALIIERLADSQKDE